MKARWLLLVAVCLAAASLGAIADDTNPKGSTTKDWPQWRGTNRDGSSNETGLLKEWPKDGPKLLWQVKEIDFGYSTPAVVGDRIYLLSNKGKNDEFVKALALKDGSEVWSKRIGKVGPNQGPQYPGARSTPTVDGDRIYALGSDGDLACLEKASGKVVWTKNVRKEFGGKPGLWAYSESPLIDGDVVVCTPGGKEATVVALKKKDGEVVWKCAVPGGDQAAYASIVKMDVGGVKQYVQFLQKGVVGVEAKTGKFLWRYDKTAKGSPANIPTPVAHNGYVYTGTGRSGGGLAKVKQNDGQWTAEEVYFDRKLPTSIGGSVLVGKYLYGTNNSGLVCLEFETGKVQWQNKSVGAGSLLYADGNLYVHSEKDEVALVEATPKEYREKGRFKLPDQPNRGNSQAWAYPVLADGKLYLRDLGVLWCYDVKAGK
jgi:outer membrane protein assembly factor BamB